MAKTKNTLAVRTPHPEWASKFHFFATSCAEWRTGHDVEALIKRFRKDGLPFDIWFVPVPESAHYKISCYAPQVEGAVLVLSLGAE